MLLLQEPFCFFRVCDKLKLLESAVLMSKIITNEKDIHKRP